jgi:hypothetical protein
VSLPDRRQFVVGSVRENGWHLDPGPAAAES